MVRLRAFFSGLGILAAALFSPVLTVPASAAIETHFGPVAIYEPVDKQDVATTKIIAIDTEVLVLRADQPELTSPDTLRRPGVLKPDGLNFIELRRRC